MSNSKRARIFKTIRCKGKKNEKYQAEDLKSCLDHKSFCGPNGYEQCLKNYLVKYQVPITDKEKLQAKLQTDCKIMNRKTYKNVKKNSGFFKQILEGMKHIGKAIYPKNAVDETIVNLKGKQKNKCNITEPRYIEPTNSILNILNPKKHGWLTYGQRIKEHTMWGKKSQIPLFGSKLNGQVEAWCERTGITKGICAKQKKKKENKSSIAVNIQTADKLALDKDDCYSESQVLWKLVKSTFKMNYHEDEILEAIKRSNKDITKSIFDQYIDGLMTSSSGPNNAKKSEDELSLIRFLKYLKASNSKFYRALAKEIVTDRIKELNRVQNVRGVPNVSGGAFKAFSKYRNDQRKYKEARAFADTKSNLELARTNPAYAHRKQRRKLLDEIEAMGKAKRKANEEAKRDAKREAEREAYLEGKRDPQKQAEREAEREAQRKNRASQVTTENAQKEWNKIAATKNENENKDKKELSKIDDLNNEDTGDKQRSKFTEKFKEYTTKRLKYALGEGYNTDTIREKDFINHTEEIEEIKNGPWNRKKFIYILTHWYPVWNPIGFLVEPIYNLIFYRGRYTFIGFRQRFIQISIWVLIIGGFIASRELENAGTFGAFGIHAIPWAVFIMGIIFSIVFFIYVISSGILSIGDIFHIGTVMGINVLICLVLFGAMQILQSSPECDDGMSLDPSGQSEKLIFTVFGGVIIAICIRGLCNFIPWIRYDWNLYYIALVLIIIQNIITSWVNPELETPVNNVAFILFIILSFNALYQKLRLSKHSKLTPNVDLTKFADVLKTESYMTNID